MDIKHLRISDIKIGKRFRKDFGDLGELAESLKAGLLQPIGVTPKHELVFGERRMLAAKALGWKTIPVRIVDVPSILEGMLTENVMRKDYTVSERVAIYRAIIAEVGSRQGQHLDGNEKRSFRAQWCGHVEIEARTREEALDIHAAMTTKEILDQLVFDGIKEDS